MDLNVLRAFQAVAEAKSFTAAGVRLRRDKAQLSREIRRLETALGASLFVRTTRSVRLTTEGDALFRKVAPLLGELEHAVAAVPDRSVVPRGTVAITTTPDLGRAILAPLLPSFRARYPAIRVDVSLSHELVDLARAGVDLALRVGKPGAGSFVARRVGELEAGFFASVDYLGRRGFPRSTAELADHDGLWAPPARGAKAFSGATAPPPAAIGCTDFGFLAEVARAGGGIAVLPTVVAAIDVARGALVRVLPEITFGGAPLYLVSPPHRPLAPRISALRDHLLASLKKS